MKIDQVIRSRRKTFALIIERDGSLTVRAPLHASQAQIERLVYEKADWIETKQKWVKSQPSTPGPKTYTPGEMFFYLGERYPLVIVPASSPALRLDEGRFQLARQALPRAPDLFASWYRQQARRLIGERLAARANELGLVYRGPRITSARSRWGSCGPKGTLNFSWRLVMAPLTVIDYVIVHELAHLRIRNHSSSFWEQVARWSPDYQQQITWLKANGRLLSL